MEQTTNGTKTAGAASELTDVLEAVATAYGFLWHVNNEPGTPNQYAPEKAAYAARKVLRELLTHEQRGVGINRVHAECLASNAIGQGSAACGASPAPTGCASSGTNNERTDK